jgi:hypothetical protein
MTAPPTSLQDSRQRGKWSNRQRRAIDIAILVLLLEFAFICVSTLAFPVVGEPHVDKGILEPATDTFADLNWEDHDNCPFAGVCDEQSPNGLVIARNGDYFDNTIQILDATSKQVLATFRPGISPSKLDVAWIDSETLAIRTISRVSPPPPVTAYYLWHWQVTDNKGLVIAITFLILLAALPVIAAVVTYRLQKRKAD